MYCVCVCVCGNYNCIVICFDCVVISSSCCLLFDYHVVYCSRACLFPHGDCSTYVHVHVYMYMLSNDLFIKIILKTFYTSKHAIFKWKKTHLINY